MTSFLGHHTDNHKPPVMGSVSCTTTTIPIVQFGQGSKWLRGSIETGTGQRTIWQ
jgi:hypothetical protein